MNHFVWIAVATAQSSALLSVALLVDRFLQHKSAALRHGLLISFLALALICPLVTASLPPLRVLPVGQPALSTARIQPNEPLQDLSYTPANAPSLNAKTMGFESSVGGGTQTRQEHFANVDEVPQEAATSNSGWSFTFAGNLIVWSWLLGSCVLLGRIVVSWVSLQYIRICGEPTSDFDALGRRSPIGARVRILVSDHVTTPLSFGLLAPCVVMPRSLLASDLDREKLEGIVLHELAHIDRCDALWQWVTLLSQSLHWFNPLVWIVSSRIGMQREIACDDHVVASGISPRTYAYALVEALQTPEPPKDPCLALSLSSKFDMDTRIRSILNGTKNRSRISHGTLALGAITVGILLVTTSILRAEKPQTAAAGDFSAAPQEAQTNVEEKKQNQRVIPTPYRNADFSKAKLRRASGREAFIEADFSRANLTNSILSGGDKGFQRASFEKASAGNMMLLGGDHALQHANFKNARLSGVVFSAGLSSFRQAVFDGAKLERATFRCDPSALSDVSVNDSNFDMADLSLVKPAVLRSWKFDATSPPLFSSLTQFPDGFSPALSGWRKLADPENEENSMTIFLLDEENQPLSGVKVFQNHVFLPEDSTADRKHGEIKNHYYFTDSNGKTTLSWPGDSEDLRIWVFHPGFIPLHAMWSERLQPDYHEIPKEFSIHLSGGTTIGGIVHDENGIPVEGAFVEVQHLIQDNTFASTERPVQVSWLAGSESAIVTDKAGRWQALNVPEGEVDLQVRVSHAQFATNEGDGATRPSLRELRAETAITSLTPRGGIKERDW